jgi:hypothetical protein
LRRQIMAVSHPLISGSCKVMTWIEGR